MAYSSPANITAKALQHLTPDQLPLLSDEQKDTAIDILMALRFTTIVISMPLAACNLVVFSRRNMRGGTGNYVIGLTLAQIVFMLGRTATIIHAFVVRDGPQSLEWKYLWQYGLNYTGLVSRRASNVVTCLVSVERLYAVLRPLHVKSFFLCKYSTVLTAGTYLTSAMWHSYLILTVDVVTSTQNSTTVHSYAPSAFYLKYTDLSIGLSLTAKVVQVFTALTVQMALNALTIWALRRHNLTTRAALSTMRDDVKLRAERQMTLTILVTTICSVIFAVPLAVANVLDDFEPMNSAVSYRYYNVRLVFQETSINFSVLACGGVDFCCYLKLSSRYRGVLLHVLGRDNKYGSNKSEKETSSGNVCRLHLTKQ